MEGRCWLFFFQIKNLVELIVKENVYYIINLKTAKVLKVNAYKCIYNNRNKAVKG